MLHCVGTRKTVFWITDHRSRRNVCENTLLQRLYCTDVRRMKKDKIAQHRRPSLLGSASTIRVIKSERVRWAGHAVHMEKTRRTCGIWIRIFEGNKPVLRPCRRDFIKKILKCRLLWIRVMLLRERERDYVEQYALFSVTCFEQQNGTWE